MHAQKYVVGAHSLSRGARADAMADETTSAVVRDPRRDFGVGLALLGCLCSLVLSIAALVISRASHIVLRPHHTVHLPSVLLYTFTLRTVCGTGDLA